MKYQFYKNSVKLSIFWTLCFICKYDITRIHL